MKRVFWIFMVLLILAFPAAAQEDEWRMNINEDFTDNSFGWPEGRESQGSTIIDRAVRDGSYQWNITTADPNFSWMALTPAYPEGSARWRFAAQVRLPDFDPLTCGGLALDSHGDSFYGYVVCNDKTYSLFRYAGGNVETLIPYTPIRDFDNFSPASIGVEINGGWADLYYNGTTLDTYNIGFGMGGFGLIAMPQSVKPTGVSFNFLTFSSASGSAETERETARIDPNASETMGRLVKMLSMKDRIGSVGGTYFTLPDRDISLAMMGYTQREPLDISAESLLLQSDIAWSSGYNRPDYTASGCGFTIRELNTNSFIEIYAAMDGGIHVNAFRYGQKVPLITLKYGSWSVEGKGRLGVAADSSKITILWNDAVLGTVTDATWLGSGAASYLVHSGTNGDFGTRCVFTNGEGYLFENNN